MKSAILFILLGTTLAGQAQQWCPPGATWVYRFTYFTNIDYRIEYRYLEDTLIDGVSAHVIQTHAFGSTGGPPINQTARIYERAQDAVIYAGSSTGGWDTLYWFGQVGERWWPIGHPQTCPPHGMLEIVATGETEVQGITLNTVTVVILDEAGDPMSSPLTITERIGTTPRAPFIDDCNIIIEYFFPSFICYSDDEIQSPEGEACHLTLGSAEHIASRPTLSLHPNPGTSFQFTGLGPRPARLRLLDMQGRVVREGLAATEHSPVDPGALKPGTYLVEIRLADGQREVIRWVKE